ncbi:MAG: hypothetical protein RMJ15_06240 [Nitrososphaerota archaeon]|nr:hypothetical protein [Candidatus Bathyarchaeota archaeon]MDW8023317.1 hypothetical protein [Nitrososphaerota archaeon]
MSKALQEGSASIISPPSISQEEKLNAETVTVIATGFLKRIGNRGVLMPKRVSLEEGTYIVEVEMKKLTAIVRVDAETKEIKEYEIQKKGEETSVTFISPKIIMVMLGISAALYVALHFAFKLFGL